MFELVKNLIRGWNVLDKAYTFGIPVVFCSPRRHDSGNDQRRRKCWKDNQMPVRYGFLVWN